MLYSRARPTFHAFLSASIIAALPALGCGGDKSPRPGAASGTAGQPPGPTLSALTPGWNKIQPGGETICSRGAPFSYFVRRGTVNRVVIEFRGGGACWNQRTCSAAGSLFQETVSADPWATDESQATGIYDHKNPENPFKDWHHVYVPYCTGDIHWGDNVMTYGKGSAAVTINHKGAANARAALDWAFANIPKPEKVFVTGCSAGAYGAIMWSAHVREHYKGAKVYQLGDSGVGIITETFFQDSYPSWKPEGSYPTWIPGVDPSKVTGLSELYTRIGGHYTDVPLSEYTTRYDEDQVAFFQAMGGGGAAEWSKQMHESLATIEAKTPGFRSFVASGDVHCILPRPELYTLETNGKRLIQWISDMVNDKPIESVKCEGCAPP